MNLVRSSPSHQSHYEYTPLFSDRSIRLIEILQETSTGVPQCTLLTVSLDSKLPFVALSYTWGNSLARLEEDNRGADQCCHILCNGRPLDVTQNLYNFLKRAKPGGPESWLRFEDKMWIDAICIDQSNLEERSAQVKLMSGIYKAATNVLVWLGEDEHGDTQNAVKLLKSISATPEDTLEELKKLLIHNPRMSEVLGECGGSTDHWRSLKRMLSRTWFSRVWIIQEIAFADIVLVLCGSCSFLWEDCVKACSFLTYSVVNEIEISSGTPYRGWHTEILSIFQKTKSAELLNILIETRSFEASDPRDKIFAVLGFATLGPALLPATEAIRIDYEDTPTEVFLDTAWVMIKQLNDLSILAEVEGPCFRKITDLPSWVPDFSSTERPRIYNQSTNVSADRGLKCSLKSLSNPRLLGTVAYRLGEVVHATSLGLNQTFIEYFPEILILFAELSPTYISGENKLEVLWRTMIQNGFNYISPAAADVAQNFRNWMILSVTGTAIKGKKNDSSRERIDRMISQLETCSKTDPTGIMPTQHDIKDAIEKAQDVLYRHPFENAESASKYRLELLYYQSMRLFRTDSGLLGLGQWSLQAGDSLWIIPGVRVPMVLRSTGAEDCFNVIGPAYVHGIMYGEALEWDGLDHRSIILE